MHRTTMGLTQRQVAALLGLHDAKPLSAWESGASMPSSLYLLKLSIIYRTYPNELYYDLFIELRQQLTLLELKLQTNE